MRTIETIAYSFTELSESSKENAREWYRNGVLDDDSWAEFIIDDFVEICKTMGVEIDSRPVRLMNGSVRQEPMVHWSGFYSQGDGASFDGTYAHRRGSLADIRENYPTEAELHRIAKALQDIQRPYFYHLTARIVTSGNYSHKYTMTASVEDDRGRDVLANIEDDILELVRDLADWVYHALRREYEWINSDEVVDENIIANKFEFSEEGWII